MRAMIGSIEQEYRRYKTLGEGALEQIADEDLAAVPGPSSNSPATLVWHVAGNLESRFTDFLTTDGEKPWRARDEEFEARVVDRDALMEKWASGWSALLDALADLEDEDLERMVSIRGRPLPVHEALHRSLAHTAYHVGQIVYAAKALQGEKWRWMSIAPGGSEAYNRNPTRETGETLPGDRG